MSVQGSYFTIEELLDLHSPLKGNGYDPNIDFEVETVSASDEANLRRSSVGIYILVKDNYPVYVGKSIDTRQRSKSHRGQKQFDKILSFESSALANDKITLKYAEFLIYFTCLSLGYNPIYNSDSTWNSLPIMGESGPLAKAENIAAIHKYAILVSSHLEMMSLKPVSELPRPIELRYTGRYQIHPIVEYWRPSIPAWLIPEATDYWRDDSPERPKYTGGGFFTVLPGTKGRYNPNNKVQQFTYDLLQRIGIIKLGTTGTTWVRRYPFPRSNLLLGAVLGSNYTSGRRDLIQVVEKTDLLSLERAWHTK